jgi:hypothetical protein
MTFHELFELQGVICNLGKFQWPMVQLSHIYIYNMPTSIIRGLMYKYVYTTMWWGIGMLQITFNRDLRYVLLTSIVRGLRYKYIEVTPGHGYQYAMREPPS